MKIERLIINYDSEKLRAIRLFATDGFISVETQLEEQLEKIYQKVVPGPARMLIEDNTKPQTEATEKKQK